MEPTRDLALLLKRTVKKAGIRQTSKLTGLPVTTVHLRIHEPGGWKLAEIRHVLNCFALNHRLTISESSPKPGARGKRKEPTVITLSDGPAPKNQPAPPRVARITRANATKSRRRPK